MDFDTVMTLLDRAGVYVFSLSGGIVAVRSRMDLFGIITLALLPAVGGGTMRDLILDVPVFWLSDPMSISLAALGGLTAFLLHDAITAFRPLRWADAAGMALFAATGAAKTFELGHALHVVLMMGTITATMGGLLRDVVANQDPLMLKEDIYAAAALAGAGAFWLAMTQAGLDLRTALAVSVFVAFTVRGCAMTFGWHLPRAKTRGDKK